MKRKNPGFTLIELLIVVAIIAILAAIAVPNFLEAQARSKVSRTKADMRTIVTGITAYRVDNNRYPYNDWKYLWAGETIVNTAFKYLTSPIAYLSSIPSDVFGNDTMKTYVWGSIINPQQAPTTGGKIGYLYETSNNPNYATYKFIYRPWAKAAFGNEAIEFELMSMGPSSKLVNTGDTSAQYVYGGQGGDPGSSIYDPTNGTMSYGHIFRCEKGMPK
jgi:type II secretion system protein G